MKMLAQWDFSKNLVLSQCRKIRSLLTRGLVVDARARATRLWNLIDYTSEPKYLLCVMIGEVPEVFADRNDTESLIRSFGNWRVKAIGSEEQFTDEAASPIQVAWRVARIIDREVSDFVYWNSTTKAWVPVMRHGGSMISKLHCVPARNAIR